MLEINKIHEGDCLKLLKEIEDNSIDLIVIDPPYNIKIDEWDKIDNYLEWIENVCIELKRVMCKIGSLYIFGSKDFIAEIKCILSRNKFNLISWNIWNKGTKAQNSTRSYADISEHCLFFVRNKDPDMKEFGKYIKERRTELNISLKKIGELCNEKWYHRGGHLYFETGLALPTREQYFQLKNILLLNNNFDWIIEEYTFNVDDIRVKRDPKEKRIFSNEKQLARNIWYSNNKLETMIGNHPTIKPLDIIEMIIKASSNEGDKVLDCFMGSGTTAVACKKLNRIFIGIEKKQKYIDIANDRLKRVNTTLNNYVLDKNQESTNINQ